MQKVFPAKLLLFGEYTIINGGDALVLPYPRFHGSWNKDPLSDTKYDLTLFYKHLSVIPGCIEARINKAAQEKWQFNSSIPTGYGLGSSGALSAAAYDTFFEPKQSLDEIKDLLSTIESYFHGTSSGFDPLSSYIQKPLFISDDQMNILPELSIPNDLFIWDSGKQRKSKPLIDYFRIMMDSDSKFMNAMKNLNVYNRKIISEIISHEEHSQTFKEISIIQHKFFKKMIPPAIISLWEEGLKTGNYYMKLNGAGGGGFFIVLTKNQNILPDLIRI